MHKQQCDFRWIMVGNHNTMKIKVKVYCWQKFRIGSVDTIYQSLCFQ